MGNRLNFAIRRDGGDLDLERDLVNSVTVSESDS